VNRKKLKPEEIEASQAMSKEITTHVKASEDRRQKQSAKVLKGLSKSKPKQFAFLVAAIVIMFAVIAGNNLYRYRQLWQSNAAMQAEITELETSNAARKPRIWENRDSDRISRDYEKLADEYKRLFTFRTLEDMARYREQALDFGLSTDTVNMLYSPDEVLAQDNLTGTETADAVNCYYSGSDIYLLGMYDDCYSYLSRVSLDVLADSSVNLIIFSDIDYTGKIVRDVCYVSENPATYTAAYATG
jgi:cell division protein FtsL